MVSPEEETASELCRRVGALVMSASITVHWAAHLIEEHDPEIGGSLRRFADHLHNAAKRLRRPAC